jgi:TIR domain
MSGTGSRKRADPQAPSDGQAESSGVAAAPVARRTRSRRRTVVISYSHKDRRMVDRLLVHLRPLERDMLIDIWEDSRIKLGAKWHSEIEDAMNSAAVAILMISADFLASDFVMKKEVPALLRTAESRGTVIMPLIIAPSLFSQSSLGCFQAVNSPASPLSKLNSHKRDEVFVRLATLIDEIAHR